MNYNPQMPTLQAKCLSRCIAIMLLCIASASLSTVEAQTYFTDDQAKTMLLNESKVVKAKIKSKEVSGMELKKEQEKLRFITLLLRDLRKGTSLETAVYRTIPKYDGKSLQSATKYIGSASGAEADYRHMRKEILNIITY